MYFLFGEGVESLDSWFLITEPSVDLGIRCYVDWSGGGLSLALSFGYNLLWGHFYDNYGGRLRENLNQDFREFGG